MMLVIGNPTISISLRLRDRLRRIFRRHVAAHLAAGLSALLVLYLLFRKKLSRPLESLAERAEVEDKGLVVIGLVHLAACVVCARPLLLHSLPDVAGGGLFRALSRRLHLCVRGGAPQCGKGGKLILRSLGRAPWVLVPFVISMFLIVLSLEKYGITERIASFSRGRGKFSSTASPSFSRQTSSTTSQ